MKKIRIPAIIFGLVLIGYAIFLQRTTSLLPPRMATHFDASGQPNGWMNRSSAVIFQGVIGLMLPLFIALIFCIIGFLPMRMINFPNRDFWFASERREETSSYLSRQGLWLASLLVLLQGLVWYQLIEANVESMPHLSASVFFSIFAVYGVAMIIWVIKVFRHFANSNVG